MFTFNPRIKPSELIILEFCFGALTSSHLEAFLELTETTNRVGFDTWVWYPDNWDEWGILKFLNLLDPKMIIENKTSNNEVNYSYSKGATTSGGKYLMNLVKGVEAGLIDPATLLPRLFEYHQLSLL